MALTAKTRRVGNVAIVDLTGRITLGESTGILRDELRSLLAQGNKQIVLNMAGVSYVDSAGLGQLVQVRTTVGNNGGALKMVNVTKRLKDLLVVTKLVTVFDSYDSEAEALASVGGVAKASPQGPACGRGCSRARPAPSRRAGPRRSRPQRSVAASSRPPDDWMRAHPVAPRLRRATDPRPSRWGSAQLSALGMASVNGAMIASNRSPLAVTI